MIVYIVTSGCYSDYSIDAVLETKEQAETYCALHPCEDQEIEEWDTAEYAVECAKPVCKKWIACISQNGEIEVFFKGYSLDAQSKMEWVHSNYCESYRRFTFTTSKDKTEEQAKKIVFDKLAALKYEEEMGMEFK